MFLSSVIGQGAAKQGLLDMHRNGRMPHAMLFIGREGTGGLPLALAFIQYLLCEDKRPADSCGACPNCQKMTRLEHADVHFSFPTISPKPGTKAASRHFMREFREFVKAKPYGSTYDWLQHINAENKQGNITAEECREIIDSLSLKSYEGGLKVQLIWRPEYLGKEGNILLKLIEEPPADTLILFVAEQTEDILPTILSRTQAVRLMPIPPAELAGALTERAGAEPRRAAQVATLAGGSYTEALQLLEHVDNDLLPDAKNLLNGIFGRRGLMIAEFAEQWSKQGREAQKNFLQYLTDLLGQSLRAAYLPIEALHIPAEEAELAKRLAGRGLPVDALEKMLETVAETAYRIERNAHGRTQLLAMGIRLQRIADGRD